MNGRLHNSVAGAGLSWVLTLLAWLEAHVAPVAGGFAVLASIYTIQAARETIKLRRTQRKKIEQEGTEETEADP